MKPLSKVIKLVTLSTLLLLSFTLNLFAEPNEQQELQRNVLFELITGTWCSACPLAAEEMNRICEKFENVIAIAYHSYDPMESFEGAKIVDRFGSGYPGEAFDRFYFSQYGDFNIPKLSDS